MFGLHFKLSNQSIFSKKDGNSFGVPGELATGQDEILISYHSLILDGGVIYYSNDSNGFLIVRDDLYTCIDSTI